MDRSALGRKTPNNQRTRVDRFVVPRDVIFDKCRRRSRSISCGHQDVDIWHTKYQKRKKYTRYLDEALGLAPVDSPAALGLEHVQTWPCRPRTKAYLSSADSILDLPFYNEAPFAELLDWGNDNILVAALGWKYHMWSWRTQNVIGQGLASDRIQCCKFDPKGELLALGTEQAVELHDSMRSKMVGYLLCTCLEDGDHSCSITALDWSPTGISLVTGCSWGVVMSFTRYRQILSRMEMEKDAAILLVRVSPDARYVAVASVNSPNIVLLTWPELHMFSSFTSDTWVIRTLSWHPWRSALLGVGAVTDDNRAQISLWDAPSCKTRGTITGRSRNILDAMLFSHRTGELVLSLWNTDQPSINRGSCSRLVVMSDPDTVVDSWGEGRSGLDRVRTMVFSPDGTKLATATSDEDLIMWNFLPEDKMKKRAKNKRFSAIPVYLDQTSYGLTLR